MTTIVMIILIRISICSSDTINNTSNDRNTNSKNSNKTDNGNTHNKQSE